MQKPLLIICSLPHSENIYDEWDIDRWENDGGRSLSIRHQYDSLYLLL
ncbi:hypothetical protein ACTHQ8_04315 [Lysinibacillus odysseyi]|nr:hypothetical protein [Lysinibacillus odysseyi]